MRIANLLAAVALATATFALSADEPWRNGERQPLWPSLEQMPDRRDGQIGAMTDERKVPGFRPEDHRMPYIEWFEAPGKPNGGCMILVSGGSYECCCDVGLIRRWRDKFTELGYQTVNLVYRTPRPDGLPIHQTAWEDGQRAIRLIRSQAVTRGFRPDKIGAIGMSAGGHLVCMLATSSMTPSYARVDVLDDIPCNLDIAIANAPAYNTLNGASGGQTVKDGIEIVPSINPCFAFDAQTCPMSLHHGGVDPWSPNGSTLFYREMRRHGFPCDLHLYADHAHGAHGFQRALEFLSQMEFVSKLEPTRPQEHRFFPGDTIRTEREVLWPSGKVPDPSSSQKYEPYLVWFVPEKLKTRAVQIIFPGGGYAFCNFNGEGAPVARYLNGKGMTAVVVMYRCPRPAGGPKHLSAWQDAQRAVRLVRSEAPSRGLDPDRIGVMGFSAGGHLTLMTATNAKTTAYEPVDEIDSLPCSVQWACPVYPAYVLTDGVDGTNKSGGNSDDALLVPELSFDGDTPPMCFFHGDEDKFSAMGSVKCWEKLRAMGVQCDLHSLAGRNHCFQFNASPGTGSWTWMDQLWDFLSRKHMIHTENPPAQAADAKPAATFLRDGDRIVFCGDSITCHSWMNAAGCCHLVTNAINVAGTARNVTVTGLGFCGNTVGDWLGREKRTRPAESEPMLSNNHGKEFVGQDVKKVLEGKVDVLAILLGMNDLLKPEVEDSDESLDAWAARYRELATNLRSRTRPRELLLGTITPLTADPHGPKNRVRDRMNERVSKLAAELGARVWEAGPAAYETIAETRRRDPAYREAPDFVHPGKLGHLAMAAAFCRAVGEMKAAESLDARRARLMDDMFPEKPSVSYRLFPLGLGDPEADRLVFDLEWNVRGMKPASVALQMPEGWTSIPSRLSGEEGTVRIEGRPDKLSNVMKICADDGTSSASVEVPVAAPWRITTESGERRLALATWDYLGRCSSASVDLYQVLFGTRTDSVVAERWIVCDRPQNVRFRIGTEAYSATQDFVVTLNGEEVWRGAMPRGTKRLEPDASLSLREGVNELSVRVGHREWQRQFTFELVGEDGGDPASLRYCWRPAR